uniref:F0F1 ATP synthase subunit gamma n=1 Tax=Hucho hucho TaxID=62062 RepID=A0A4W5LCN8_9TELE
MANLKEIRNRITSISSTMQITSAMKMVSAAKLKKAQDAITAMRKKGNDILSKTLKVVDNQSTIFDHLSFDNVAVIAETLTQKFVSGEYDKIELIYNQFKNAATQIVQTEQFLPLAPI